jgi:CRISPR system Cascade subunit CasB
LSQYELIAAYVNGRISTLDADTPWAKSALAKLRRGIGKDPGELPEIWEIIFGDLPLELHSSNGRATKAEWAIHTSLTLYALHRQGKNISMNDASRTVAGKRMYGKSLGGAARRLIKSDRSNEQSIKRRFDAIATAQNLTELAHHARGLVQLLKAADPYEYYCYKFFHFQPYPLVGYSQNMHLSFLLWAAQVFPQPELSRL